VLRTSVGHEPLEKSIVSGLFKISVIKNVLQNQAWWYTSVILALGKKK
jgi:hypothetical protein